MPLKPLLIRNAVPLLLALAGVLVVLYSLFSMAAALIPYPDPTPELLAEQQADLQVYRSVLFTGLGMVIVGLVVSLARFLVRFHRR